MYLMTLAVFTLGKIGFFTEHGWFYLELLVLLFSIGAGVLWLIEKAKHRREKPISTSPTPMGSIPTHLLRTKAGRIGKTLGVLILGSSGWIWHYAHYVKEYEAWKREGDEYQKSYRQNTEAWQKEVAAWKARQKENR